jgi:hypothetical protein
VLRDVICCLVVVGHRMAVVNDLEVQAAQVHPVIAGNVLSDGMGYVSKATYGCEHDLVPYFLG